MKKGSLVLPAKYQNQARLIKQRKYRHSLEYRSMPVKAPLISRMMEKATMIFHALKHDEVMWQFVDNLQNCLNLLNIAQLHTWPFFN